MPADVVILGMDAGRLLISVFLLGAAAHALDEDQAHKLPVGGQPAGVARQMVEELHRLPKSGKDVERLESEWLERVAKLGLNEAVAEIERPRDDAPYQERQSFALLLVGLGMQAEYLTRLQGLLLEKPDDAALRDAVFKKVPQNEQVGLLDRVLGKTDTGLARSWFKSQAYRAGTKQNKVLALFLERLDPDAKNDLSWVVEELTRVAKVTYECSDLIPKSRAGEANAQAQRILRAALRHPHLCEQAFMWLYASSPALTEDELEQAALGIVLMELCGKLSSGTLNEPAYFPDMAPDAMDYLIQQQARGRPVDPFSKEMLAKVTANNPERAKLIRGFLAMMDEPDLMKFEAWRKSDAKAPLAEDLLLIAHMAVFRQRLDLLEAAVDVAVAVAVKATECDEAIYRVMATRIKSQADAAARRKAVDDLAGRLLQRDQVAKPGGMAGEGDVIDSKGQGMLMRLTRNLVRDSAGTVALARWLVRHQLGPASQLSLQSVLVFDESSPEATLRRWIDTGFIAMGPELVLTAFPPDRSMLEITADWLRKKPELLPHLEKLQGPERFAARLLEATVDLKPALAYAEINGQSAAIGLWTAEERASLARILLKWFPDMPETATGYAGELFARSEFEALTAAVAKAEDYMRDGFPENFKPRSADRKFAHMLNLLIANEKKMAAKLWRATMEAYRRPREQQARFDPKAYLAAVLALDEVSFPGLVRFIGELEKQSPGVAYATIDARAVERAFDCYMKARKQAAALDPSVKALPESVQSFADALDSLVRDMPSGDQPVLAGVFALSHARVPDLGRLPADQLQLLKWLDDELGPRCPELAQAAALSVWTKLPGRQLTTDDVMVVRKLLTAFLGNAAIPATLRLSMLERLSQQSSFDLWINDAECAHALAKVLASLAAADLPRVAAMAVHLANLEALASLDAAQVLNAIQEVLRQQPESAQGFKEPLQRLLFTLAIRSGQTEALDRLARMGAVQFHGDLELAVWLWRTHHDPMAVSLLAAPDQYHFQTLRNVAPPVIGKVHSINAVVVEGEPGLSISETPEGLPDLSAPVLPFTYLTESRLPQWLATLKEPQQRFRIECMISSAPDGEGELAPLQPRKQRLEALVRRFPQEAPQTREARTEVLLALADQDAAAASLADEYLQAIGQETLVSAAKAEANGNPTPPVVLTAMIHWAMRFAILQYDDASSLVKQLNAIQMDMTGPSVKRDNKDRASKELNTWMLEDALLIVRHMLDIPLERRAKLARQSLEIATTLIKTGDSNLCYLAGFLAANTQAVAGDGAAADRWAASLPADYRGPRLPRDCAYLSMLGPPPLWGTKHPQSRRALLASILSDEATYSRALTDRSGEYVGLEFNFYNFTREDLLAVIEQIAPRHPHRAELLAMKASFLSNNGTPKEEIVRIYEQAVEAAAGDAKVDALVRYEYAHHLNRANEKQKAVAMARTIHLPNLAKVHRSIIKRILEQSPK